MYVCQLLQLLIWAGLGISKRDCLRLFVVVYKLVIVDVVLLVMNCILCTGFHCH